MGCCHLGWIFRDIVHDLVSYAPDLGFPVHKDLPPFPCWNARLIHHPTFEQIGSRILATMLNIFDRSVSYPHAVAQVLCF
jgi:hypothetical protein